MQIETEIARRRLPILPTREQADALRSLREELEDEVSGDVRFDDGARALYATDASNYRQVPIGVVVPRTSSDVEATVAACRRHDVPVLARGAGTSLAGQSCNVAVIMDMTQYRNRVLSLDADRHLVTVEPGALLDSVRRQIQDRAKLTVGPDPSTHKYCAIGGMIGNDSCGAHAQAYGRMSQSVDALDILTYAGTRIHVGRTSEEELERVIRRGGELGAIYSSLRNLRDRYGDLIRKRFPKLTRRVSGYNNLDQLLPENGFHLARALCGTEGTCVTFLEATLNAVAFQPYSCLILLGYDDIYAAAEDVPFINSYRPAGLEGFDQALVDDIRKTHLEQKHLKLLPLGQGWLMVQFWGQSREEANGYAHALMEAIRHRSRPPTIRFLDDPEQMGHMWKLRESGLGATARVPGQPDAWPGWEDSAVTPENLAAYLPKVRKLLDRYGYAGALYGHFGQGCVHSRITFDVRTPKGIEHWRSFLYEAADLVVSYGGSLSGEHGDGQQRAELLEKMYGPELVECFREFKRIWDPQNRMNPGKLIDAYRIDQNLRLTQIEPRDVKTHFRFPEDDGHFERATERCVGVGKCRSLEGTTMCPSYMVTREEEHSTRGRTHLLFEMLQGDVVKGGWRNEHVHEALDLCLACKGCKGDCPMKVDVASYKAEFLSHYYAGRLRPRSAYAFGLIHWWAKLGSLLPHLANAATHLPGLSLLAKRLSGMPLQREIPPFAPNTFRSWFEAREAPASTGERVLLWADTFNNHFHPEVAQAAVEVLEDAGYQVKIQEAGLCCGRPLYDYGMLRQAKRQLRSIMRSLRRELRQGTPIVGLEPSCIAVFRDELRNLFPTRPEAHRLAGQTFHLSEFLEKKAKTKGWEAPKLARQAVVHGHCHHKSVLGFDEEKQLLKDMGLESNILDSGCCGMAGSFGFEERHYDVSIKAGERVLLPAVREASADSLVIADGFSCREQIEQQTDRRALHIAQVLQMAYREGTAGPRRQPPETGYGFDRKAVVRRSIRRALAVGGAVAAGVLIVRWGRLA